MAESTQIRIDGLRELKRALEELPKAAQGRALRAALRAGARVIERDAKTRAPVVTGRLRENIRVQNVRNPRGRTYTGRQIANAAEARAHMQIGVRSKGKRGTARNAFYWRFIEFGTSQAPPRPFLRPAFESKKREAVEVFAARIKLRIHAEAKRLGRLSAASGVRSR